ncbi:MAG: rhomboid family intramembrane serine protease [Clostridia bacterium]|nr:rhomboid family intramembrane serine protease [Clostridia bacterium]
MSYIERPLRIQRTAPATYVILGINLAVFIMLEVSGGSRNPWVLVNMGAKYAPAIRAGEWWRLITSIFLHSGLFHLAANSYSLYNLGSVTERLFGTPRFIIAYLAAGLWGSIFSTIFADPRMIGVGASGAIFGLAGCLFYFGLRYPRQFRAIAGARFIVLVILNLGIGFATAVIDNYAHIGGLLGGFAAAYLLGLRGEPSTRSRVVLRALLAIATLLGAAIAAWPSAVAVR